MKRNNIIAIGVIVFALAVAIGYALFQESLNVTGTATAQGTFDVQFTQANIQTEVGSSGAQANIEEGGKTLTITVPKLEYPGAYVEIPVTVTNKGSIPAILTNIEETGLTVDSRAVKVTYTGLTELKNQEVTQNGTQTFTIKVEWDPNVNTGAEDVSFSIRLDYKQKTAE